MSTANNFMNRFFIQVKLEFRIFWIRGGRPEYDNPPGPGPMSHETALLI